jgi:hypothetical protein
MGIGKAPHMADINIHATSSVFNDRHPHIDAFRPLFPEHAPETIAFVIKVLGEHGREHDTVTIFLEPADVYNFYCEIQNAYVAYMASRDFPQEVLEVA